MASSVSYWVHYTVRLHAALAAAGCSCWRLFACHSRWPGPHKPALTRASSACVGRLSSDSCLLAMQGSTGVATNAVQTFAYQAPTTWTTTTNLVTARYAFQMVSCMSPA